MPVETQTARLSICAQLPGDRAVQSTTADDLYTLTFNAGVDGALGGVTLIAGDGRPLGGRIAECFSGVLAQVELGRALGGTCSAAVPIRVSRRSDVDRSLLVASSQR